MQAKTIVDDRFQIIELIGSGGMGAVYKADQVGLDRIVALKVLLPHLLQEPQSLARFELEAQALAALTHPNILLFYAYGVWHGRAPYIAMEYLESGDLSDLLIAEGGRLSWRRTMNIARQIAEALAHAHGAGIIHRDLKPSNIFVVRDGSKDLVKVADFGLAKFVHDSAAQKLTATGLTVGTPHYMSPEQVQGLPATASCDIYSLGCVMYQCLFGRPPEFQSSAVLPKAQGLKDFPPALIHFVETALAKDPAVRFSSMEEVVTGLAEMQRSAENLRDSKANFIPPVQPVGGQRHSKTAQLCMLAIALIAAISIVGTVLFREHSAGQDSVQRKKIIGRLSAKANRYFAKGSFAEAADCRRQVLALVENSDTVESLKIRSDSWQGLALAEMNLAHYEKAEEALNNSIAVTNQYLEQRPADRLDLWSRYEHQISLYSHWNKIPNCLVSAKNLFDLSRKVDVDRIGRSVAEMYYGYFLCLNDRCKEGMPLLLNAVAYLQRRAAEEMNPHFVSEFQTGLQDMATARDHCGDAEEARRLYKIDADLSMNLKKGTRVDLSKIDLGK